MKSGEITESLFTWNFWVTDTALFPVYQHLYLTLLISHMYKYIYLHVSSMQKMATEFYFGLFISKQLLGRLTKSGIIMTNF